MKYIFFAAALLCASLSANAQHSLQVDDGAGNIGIITGPTSGGMSMFALPLNTGYAYHHWHRRNECLALTR